MDETFGKSYKLGSQKTIAAIFKKGKSVKQYPFVVQFMEQPGMQKERFQLVFSAPKRAFKRAHDRNRIKRLMRETFRKKKLILEEALAADNKYLSMFVIYTAKEELPYELLMKKTNTLLEKIAQEFKHGATEI